MAGRGLAGLCEGTRAVNNGHEGVLSQFAAATRERRRRARSRATTLARCGGSKRDDSSLAIAEKQCKRFMAAATRRCTRGCTERASTSSGRPVLRQRKVDLLLPRHARRCEADAQSQADLGLRQVSGSVSRGQRTPGGAMTRIRCVAVAPSSMSEEEMASICSFCVCAGSARSQIARRTFGTAAWKLMPCTPPGLLDAKFAVMLTTLAFCESCCGARVMRRPLAS